MSQSAKKDDLIIVAYAFPPFKSMSSFRNGRIAKFASNYFNTLNVISTSNMKLLPKEIVDFKNDINLFKSRTIDYRTFSHSDQSSGVGDTRNPLRIFFRNLKNSFPFNLFFGMGGFVYILHGIRIGKKLLKDSEQNIYIFSSFRPYADHVIAYILKRSHPQVKWIADFNNLHIEPDTKRVVFKKVQEYFNHKIVSSADVVSTVSEGLVPHLEKFNQNVVVLENGIDHEAFDVKKEKLQKFTISYSGSLYREQSLAPLLKVLNKLIEDKKIDKSQLVIQYCGASSNEWNKQVKEFKLLNINQDYGVLSMADAFSIQCNSHINLLLTWNTNNLDGIIPGKYYDYLASQRPMLVLLKGSTDAVWEAKMNNSDAGVLFYDQSQHDNQLEAFILGKYNDFKSQNESSFLVSQEMVNEHKWENQMDNFINAIK